MSKTETASPLPFGEKTKILTDARMIAGLVAFAVGAGGSGVAFKFTQNQQGKDIAQLQVDFKEFKKDTTDALTKISGTQEAHFEKLIDKIDALKSQQAHAYFAPSSAPTSALAH